MGSLEVSPLAFTSETVGNLLPCALMTFSSPDPSVLIELPLVVFLMWVVLSLVS